MDSKQEPRFPLSLLVDKERNHVVVAEAKCDFIDILFSFLTLPLGTIIRLVYKKQQQEQQQQQQETIGCINNLYQSVENLGDDDDGVFWNKICKRMLLCPRNPCESLCKKLKVKVDDGDSEPTRYFMCGCWCTFLGSENWLSTFGGATCCSCGKLMDKELKMHGDDDSSDVEETDHHQRDGVFVNGGTMYLIYDDLKVLQSSPGNSLQQLLQLGYKNFHKLTEMFVNVGLNEILDLLKQALTSTSPLSDVFLGNGEFKKMDTFSPKNDQRLIHNYVTINLKVTVRKSKKKILYAEADSDFVDFLFSFLTTPIGSVLELLNDDNFSLGCMHNLHKSVKDLNPSWFTRPLLDTLLLNPKVAPQFGCIKQPLNLCEQDTPTYWHGTGVLRNNICYSNPNGVISKNSSLIQNPRSMRLFDPRSPDGGKRNSAVGFVRRPSLFVVRDDLQVTPLANTSSVLFLQKLNVPLDDLEEHVVSIGEREALNLLGASLTSKAAALTEGLFHLLKKPKDEAKA